MGLSIVIVRKALFSNKTTNPARPRAGGRRIETENRFGFTIRFQELLFQNFSFGTATIDLRKKRASDRFFQEPVEKP
jgi:hypothetical protein